MLPHAIDDVFFLSFLVLPDLAQLSHKHNWGDQASSPSRSRQGTTGGGLSLASGGGSLGTSRSSAFLDAVSLSRGGSPSPVQSITSSYSSYSSESRHADLPAASALLKIGAGSAEDDVHSRHPETAASSTTGTKPTSAATLLEVTEHSVLQPPSLSDTEVGVMAESASLRGDVNPFPNLGSFLLLCAST